MSELVFRPTGLAAIKHLLSVTRMGRFYEACPSSPEPKASYTFRVYSVTIEWAFKKAFPFFGRRLKIEGDKGFHIYVYAPVFTVEDGYDDTQDLIKFASCKSEGW